MDMIHAIGEEVCLRAPFEVGDMQFLNQHVTYHGRTQFTDDPSRGAQRVLLRIWLAAPFTRMLPDGQRSAMGRYATRRPARRRHGRPQRPGGLKEARLGLRPKPRQGRALGTLHFDWVMGRG
jgi:hypothetical protein